VVGVASLFRVGADGTAELGVLAEDVWQRRGIGQRLVSCLLQRAPARGITVLTASVLGCNETVANLLRRIPGAYSATITGSTLQVRVRLTRPGTHSAVCPCTPASERQPVVQGRSFSGLRTAQMCVIKPPARSNANTVTVTPSC
jgi:hypothetical protein